MSTNLLKNRTAAFNHQSGRCCYCNFPLLTTVNHETATALGLSVAVAKRLKCTAEHLNPKSCRGGSGRDNIAAACHFCNQTRHRAKKVLSPENYKIYVRRRVSSGKWHPKELRRAFVGLVLAAA